MKKIWIHLLSTLVSLVEDAGPSVSLVDWSAMDEAGAQTNCVQNERLFGTRFKVKEDRRDNRSRTLPEVNLECKKIKQNENQQTSKQKLNGNQKMASRSLLCLVGLCWQKDA